MAGELAAEEELAGPAGAAEADGAAAELAWAAGEAAAAAAGAAPADGAEVAGAAGEAAGAPGAAGPANGGQAASTPMPTSAAEWRVWLDSELHKYLDNLEHGERLSVAMPDMLDFVAALLQEVVKHLSECGWGGGEWGCSAAVQGAAAQLAPVW